MAQVTGLMALRDQCDELRRERDELLAALEAAYKMLTKAGYGKEADPFYKLIDKIKGGSMSTPRTDNALQQMACFAGNPAVECLSDLARQLERENARLREVCQKLRTELIEACHCNNFMSDEIEDALFESRKLLAELEAKP